MRILSIVHQIDAGSGVFGAVAAARSDDVVEWIPAQGPAPEGPFDGAMVFGGAMHPDQEQEHPWLSGEKELLGELHSSGTPMLCTCLGAELLAEAAGGGTSRLDEPEIGWYEIALNGAAGTDPVLGRLPREFAGFQWHSYGTPAPPGASVLAQSQTGHADAFRSGNAWGFQFHAEITPGIVGGWIDRYREDEDAVRIGLDPEPLRTETAGHIEAWNALGERIAAGFLDFAADRQRR